MLFKHSGSVKITGRGSEASKGNKVSFLGRILGSSSKDENGEAAGTASVVGDFDYEFSAEISADELQQLYNNNRNDMNNVVEDMNRIMQAVRTCYDEGKKIALDAIDASHKNDLENLKRCKEYDEVYKKLHPKEKGTETESKSE